MVGVALVLPQHQSWRRDARAQRVCGPQLNRALGHAMEMRPRARDLVHVADVLRCPCGSTGGLIRRGRGAEWDVPSQKRIGARFARGRTSRGQKATQWRCVRFR